MFPPILSDAIVFLMGLYLIKTFIFKKDLSDRERFIIEHSYTWVRVVIVIIMELDILYWVGTDLRLLDGRFYIEAVGSFFLIFYLVGLIILYNRHKYGPKDFQYVESTKMGAQAAIALAVIAFCKYIFS